MRHLHWVPRLSNRLPPPIFTVSTVGHYDERRGESEIGQYQPQMVRSRDVESVSETNKLTRESSIQDALRMFLQPIKNDDPKIVFYTMYKREATEYDTAYMQNYNEDLNTTLIFVRFSVLFITEYLALTALSGRSILGGQLRLRHRHPIQTRARPRRTIRSLPPSNPPQPQPFHLPKR